jgi:hypothetical protein
MENVLMGTANNERHFIAVCDPSDDGLPLNVCAVTADQYAVMSTALAKVQGIEMNLHLSSTEQDKQALDGLVTTLDRSR